jgi:hypothetical protein
MDNRTNTFAFLYKLGSLAVGLIIVLLGYNLFRIGFIEAAGDLRAQSGDRSISLTHAAPGVFFALFGAFVIGVTIYKGLQFAQTQATELPRFDIAPAQQEWRAMAAAINALEASGKVQGQDIQALRNSMVMLAKAIFPLGQVSDPAEPLGPASIQAPPSHFGSFGRHTTAIARAAPPFAGPPSTL